MKFSVVVAFLSAAISFGDALRCYHCSSKESWDQCTPSKAEKVTCPAGYEMCIKMHTNISYQDGRPHYKSFFRSCYTKGACNDTKISVLDSCRIAKDAGIDADCDVNCCNDDLCNDYLCSAGAAPVVSVLLALSYALFAIFR